jgi:hypothetical protein
MIIALHKNATTTPASRKAIQNAVGSDYELARQFGVGRVRISAIADACFRLIADGISTRSAHARARSPDSKDHLRQAPRAVEDGFLSVEPCRSDATH